VWGRRPMGVWGRSPQCLDDFYFNKNEAFYSYLDLNLCFKTYSDND